MPNQQIPVGAPVKTRTTTNSLELSSKLRQTCGLSGPDVAHVTQFLRNADLDVKTYHSEIKKRHAEIISLQNRMEGLQRHAEAYGSLLAPIRKLPLELLTKLFVEYCADGNVLGEEVVCPALVLSHVSGGWRELALSTPKLWSNLSVDFDYHQREGWASMIKVMMTRSKKSPLTLSIHSEDTFEDIDACLPAIQTLAEHSSHWHTVTLDIDDQSFLHPALSNIRWRLPMLESLAMKCNWNLEDPADPVELFDTAPKLTTFRGNGVTAADPKLPWNQITSLHLVDSTLLNTLQVMEVCPQLIDMSYEGTLADNEEDEYPQTVPSFKGVFSLSLNPGNRSTDMLSLLSSWITLPQLQTLSIFTDLEFVAWAWKDVDMPQFITRSGCQITTLSLKSLPITDLDLIPILTACPSLTKLILHESSAKTDYAEQGPQADIPNLAVTHDLVSKLTVNHAGYAPASVVPMISKLEDLELCFHYNNDGRRLVEALCTLVRTRWLPDKEYADDVGVACLRSVSFLVMGSGFRPEYFAIPTYLGEVGLRFSATRIL
ncbi:hypothetical protein VKT23_006094 [Stygiomarasmius scandens]|uniref:F-box domain-containing protein n=1 Tax=Marasmiellus scandens TaxID=2682957 RepID=A0ABR1JRA2_9AGAR